MLLSVELLGSTSAMAHARLATRTERIAEIPPFLRASYNLVSLQSVMIGYNILLFVHVLSATIWLGGGIMLSLMGLRARRNPDLASDFGKLLPYVGLRVLMPAVVLLPVTGVWMVLADSEWSFQQAWTRAALGLFVIAFLVGAVYLSQVGIAMGRAASAGGSAAAALPALLSRWLVGYAAVLAVLLVAVADMVFKPGAG